MTFCVQIQKISVNLYFIKKGDKMSKWVLLLGGSTGHGAATAKKLALRRLWYYFLSF